MIREIFLFLLIIALTIVVSIAIVHYINLNKNRSSSVLSNNTTKENLSFKLEKKIGELIKRQILVDSKIINNIHLKNGIDDILHILLLNMTINPYDKIDIFVIESSEVNAVALPGGIILVFSGLIQLSDNPYEVAAVIAHELGHVINRDPIEALTQQFGLSIILSSISSRKTSATISEMVKTLVNNSYTRIKENQADSFAIELLTLSNINPKHLAVFFEKLKKHYDLKPSKYLKYLQTHPNIEERIKKAENASATFKNNEIKPNADWTKMKQSLPSIFNE